MRECSILGRFILTDSRQLTADSRQPTADSRQLTADCRLRAARLPSTFYLTAGFRRSVVGVEDRD